VTANGWRGPGWRVYGAHPRHGKAVREWIANAVASHDCPVDPSTAALAVSELFTNAILHGPPGGRVLVGYCLWNAGVRIVVCDGGGAATPQLRDPANGEEGGRGLHVVEALSAHWDSFRASGAQIVWCDLGQPLAAAHSDAWAWLAGPLVMVRSSNRLREQEFKEGATYMRSWGWCPARGQRPTRSTHRCGPPGAMPCPHADVNVFGNTVSSSPGTWRPGGRGEAVAGLSGTGLVADDLYLMAHHEVSGKPYVQPRALGLGLAGGLLAELMLAGNISLWHEGVVVAGHAAPEEGLARHVLSLLTGEHEHHPIRDWLLFLARTAAQDVARRLEGSRYLTRVGGRWRGRRWVPADADSAFAPLLQQTMPGNSAAVPSVVSRYAAYPRAKAHVVPETTVNGDQAGVRVSIGDAALVLLSGAAATRNGCCAAPKSSSVRRPPPSPAVSCESDRRVNRP
jgi:anti-sigma regulatory factor (Ser/Thr protein kinase)